MIAGDRPSAVLYVDGEGQPRNYFRMSVVCEVLLANDVPTAMKNLDSWQRHKLPRFFTATH